MTWSLPLMRSSARRGQERSVINDVFCGDPDITGKDHVLVTKL